MIYLREEVIVNFIYKEKH